MKPSGPVRRTSRIITEGGVQSSGNALMASMAFSKVLTVESGKALRRLFEKSLAKIGSSSRIKNSSDSLLFSGWGLRKDSILHNNLVLKN